ncbi:unnamed protein product [Amaranthus hypochondriacus]
MAKQLPQWLHSYLTEFDNKRRTTRENALNSLVNALISSPKHEFVEGNHITICHNCLTRLTSKKKGSNKFSKFEICQSVRAISLLVINLVHQDSAHQVFDECLPILSDALVNFKSHEIDVIFEVLSCFGIVGFLGSCNSMEIEKVMLLIWDLINPNNNLESSVLGAAIDTWVFLLSGVQKQNLSMKFWKNGISYFSELLLKRKDCGNNDNDNEDVVLAATNALGLIFHIDMIHKFSDKSKEGEDEDYSSLKEEIFEKIKRNLDGMKFCNLSQIIQVKFMRKFLGKEGLRNHMDNNENFHRLFEPLSNNKGKKAADNVVDDAPEREEVVHKYFQHKFKSLNAESDELLTYVSEKEKKVKHRLGKSANSSLNKARTLLLNKQRKAANQFSTESELYD